MTIMYRRQLIFVLLASLQSLLPRTRPHRGVHDKRQCIYIQYALYMWCVLHWINWQTSGCMDRMTHEQLMEESRLAKHALWEGHSTHISGRKSRLYKQKPLIYKENIKKQLIWYGIYHKSTQSTNLFYLDSLTFQGVSSFMAVHLKCGSFKYILFWWTGIGHMKLLLPSISLYSCHSLSLYSCYFSSFNRLPCKRAGMSESVNVNSRSSNLRLPYQ